MRGIRKEFPGIVANDHVSFDLRKGEVHALLGENGAGKSTLMNILYGLYTPDEGEILLNGKPIELGATKTAIEHGIGMVHQHFMLIPVMTVAENIVLATEPKHAGVLLDYNAAGKRVRELSERYGLAVDPDARIDRITVGQQQRVEILKALYRGAEILILDEPTAVLTPQEASELFEILRSLKAQGKSIIFISHKLNEVLEIADRITTLRRGVVVGTVPAADATEEGLARMMVGREVLLRVDKKPPQPGAPLLQVENLSVIDDRGLDAVRDVSLEVRGGGPSTPAFALSGGNQQKVVLAREIDGDPKVLIAAQPTRGLDVGAIEFVHRRLVEQRDAGRAVLLVSLELEEILSLSDRILVIYEGRIVGEFPPTATEEELGFAMTGGRREEAA